jgi:thiol-disulfide isomerase/thioredoxin
MKDTALSRIALGLLAVWVVGCSFFTGARVGKSAPLDASFRGYVERSTTASTIALRDYSDPDGAKGINAVLIIVSATWCIACQYEARTLEREIADGWGALGIRVLTLMTEDTAANPATEATALEWKKRYKLDSVAVAADPGRTFELAGKLGTSLPTKIVIDPRTMKIVDVQEGFNGKYPALLALAQANKR